MQDIDVIQRINSQRPTMSKGQKRIADYTAKHYDSAAFMTAAALGEKAEVSESTVVRFAMALGYDGYAELQKSLQEMVRNKLTNLQRINLLNKTGENTAASVIKSDINNLRATLDYIDPNIFDAAVEFILASKAIYIVGHRSASVLSRFLAYYMDFILPNIKELPASQDAFDQLARAGEGDLLIAISFPRYSALTMECVRIAKERGAGILAITDGRLSPLVPLADYYLYARSAMASFVDSLVAPLSLLNAIIVACGSSRDEDVVKHFEELEQIWAEYAVYSQEEN